MDKVAKVMSEFKEGALNSSAGPKVTNPKQAIAIALSEAGKSKPTKSIREFDGLQKPHKKKKKNFKSIKDLKSHYQETYSVMPKEG